MKKTLSLLICCLIAQLCLAQSSTEVKTHFDKLAKGETSTINKKDMVAYYQQDDVITLLESYLQSDNKKVQREAVRLCANIGSNNKNAATRKTAVNQLVAIAPKGSGSINRRITKGLEKFKQEDFDASAQKTVAMMIKKKQNHQDKWIALAGFLQLWAPLDELRVAEKGNKKLFQKINMALTRAGDEAKKKNLMRNVKKIKVNDEFVFSVVPLLVYARQKETMDFLFDIILSDEKSCRPVGPDVGGNIECGYRVMEAIAPYIKDIPLELGSSGDLKTDDYKKALKDTRTWIIANKENYELITNVF